MDRCGALRGNVALRFCGGSLAPKFLAQKTSNGYISKINNPMVSFSRYM